MGTSIVVGIDVYADVDPEHACATIRRVGGGLYRVVATGERADPDPLTGKLILNRPDYATIDEAEAEAAKIAANVEADPALMSPASVHVKALALEAQQALDAERADRAVKQASDARRIAQLEAELAKEGTPVPPVLPVVPSSDKGR